MFMLHLGWILACLRSKSSCQKKLFQNMLLPFVPLD